MQEHLALLKQYFGDYEQHGHDYYFYCPNMCHKYKKKLSVDLEKGKYHCWICGYGGSNLYWLFLKFFPENAAFWKRVFNEQVEKENYFNRPKLNDKDKQLLEEKNIQWALSKYSVLACDVWKNLPSEILQYFKRKKITRDSAFLWNIRIDPQERNCVLVPSFDLKFKVDYYSIRNFSERSGFKFSRPSCTFDWFNSFWWNNSKEIVLVENVFDAMRFPISGVMPVLGRRVNKLGRFASFCRERKIKIKIFFDTDALKDAIDAYYFFVSESVQVYIVKNVFGKDLDDLDGVELLTCLDSCYDHDDILPLSISLI